MRRCAHSPPPPPPSSVPASQAWPAPGRWRPTPHEPTATGVRHVKRPGSDCRPERGGGVAMTDRPQHGSDTPLYPIREVSRLTGVNSVTLRAWERRYGLKIGRASCRERVWVSVEGGARGK